MSLLRLKPGEARNLSSDLRESNAKHLRCRRGVIGLSMIGGASLAFIGLYQMGIIKHLPDPPVPYMDADRVDASPEAYERFSMPDAILGVASYAATMALAAMGRPDRAKTQSWMPLTLALKTAYDAYNAGRLTVDQWTKHRAFCFWCLIAAGATFATVPLVIPETRDALRNLRLGKTSQRLRKAA